MLEAVLPDLPVVQEFSPQSAQEDRELRLRFFLKPLKHLPADSLKDLQFHRLLPPDLQKEGRFY